MSDSINRQNAIYIVKFECGEWIGLAKTITDGLKQLPSAEPEQETGKWIFKKVFPEDKSEFPDGYLVCSNCGSHHANANPLKYCDNCGAKMEV